MSKIIKSLSETTRVVASSLMKSGCPVVLFLLQKGYTLIPSVQLSENGDSFLVTGGITAGSLYQPEGASEAMQAKESIILLGERSFTTSKYLSCDRGDTLVYSKHPAREFYVLAVLTASTKAQAEAVKPTV